MDVVELEVVRIKVKGESRKVKGIGGYFQRPVAVGSGQVGGSGDGYAEFFFEVGDGGLTFGALGEVAAVDVNSFWLLAFSF